MRPRHEKGRSSPLQGDELLVLLLVVLLLVVLLHGLGRTPASMLAFSLAARRRGYRVLNWHDRSTRATIAGHSANFAREVLPRLRRSA